MYCIATVSPSNHENALPSHIIITVENNGLSTTTCTLECSHLPPIELQSTNATLITIKREDALLIHEPLKTVIHHRRLYIMNNVATIETYEPLTREQLVVEQVPVSS